MIQRRTVLAGAGALVAAGSGPARAETGVTDDEIRIGLFGALSGPLAVNSVDAVNAAKAWYADVNARGGVHGRKIRLVVEDEKCSPAEANAVARKLITVDKVFALHGGSCSGVVVSLQELANREKIPHVFLNASGDSAVFPPTRYQFGAFAGTERSTMAAVMTFAAKTLKGKRLAIIGPDDDMGRAASRFARAAAAKLGVEIVTVETAANNQTDVTVPLLNTRAAKPDVILLTTYTAPTVLLLQKAQEFGMTLPMVGAIQAMSSAPQAFAKAVGDNAALANFYYTNPLATQIGSARLQPFMDMFAKAYPAITTPSQVMPYGFNSAIAVVKGLEAAGRDLTRDGFVDAMQTLDYESPITVGRIKFGPERRDAVRGQVVLKWDGKTLAQQPGAYEWDELVAPDNPSI
ncbi:MAG: ABC transporter substrate-binding protein [Janthinobacterium lividum]